MRKIQWNMVAMVVVGWIGGYLIGTYKAALPDARLTVTAPTVPYTWPERNDEPPVLWIGEKLQLTRAEAAAVLSLSVRTLTSLVRSGKIRGKRVGRLLMFTRTEIEKFVKGGDVDVVDPRRARGEGSTGCRGQVRAARDAGDGFDVPLGVDSA